MLCPKKTNATVRGNVFGVSYNKRSNGYVERTKIIDPLRIIYEMLWGSSWIEVKYSNKLKNYANIIKALLVDKISM